VNEIVAVLDVVLVCERLTRSRRGPPYLRSLAWGLRSITSIEVPPGEVAEAIDPTMHLLFADRCRQAARYLDALEEELRHAT
jgi:hypothetical protein